MTSDGLKRLRELADEPLLPLDTDRILLQTAELELRLLQGQLGRLALCPDHRDKATGRCIVCVAVERAERNLLDSLTLARARSGG